MDRGSARSLTRPPLLGQQGVGTRDLRVIPLPHRVAKQVVEKNHYLHSMPGGTELCFGVLADSRLKGVLTLGAGPANAYRLVDSARREDCLVLSRYWLSDDLPKNSASRILGMTMRVLKRSTDVKFVVTYADPVHGHAGIIYQASNWIYTGFSEAVPMFDLGDGVARHSRSVSYSLGTHNTTFLAARGIRMKKVPQQPKHRYVYFLDRSWRSRLSKPELPYPKQLEVLDAGA